LVNEFFHIYAEKTKEKMNKREFVWFRMKLTPAEKEKIRLLASKKGGSWKEQA
jgi:hypothetical protein